MMRVYYLHNFRKNIIYICANVCKNINGSNIIIILLIAVRVVVIMMRMIRLYHYSNHYRLYASIDNIKQNNF